MAASAGEIRLPLFTRLDGREIELGEVSVPISMRLSPESDAARGVAHAIVKAGE